MKRYKKLAIFTTICFLSTAGYFLHSGYKQRAILEKRTTEWFELGQALEQQISSFEGKAYIVIKDLEKGWSYVFNETESAPSASLAKIPVMAACYYASKKNTLDLEEKITLKQEHKVSGSGVLKNIVNGKEFTISELVELMIVKSDNTATNILIEELGYDFLNGFIKKIGLRNTNIYRKMMEMDKRSQGIENYTTAEDMALILEKIYKGTLVDRYISDKCLELLKNQEHNDRIPARLPDDIDVAHKTGLERFVCHDVGIIFTKNCDILISVLTKHRDKSSRRSKKYISEAAYLAYSYSTQISH